MRERDPSTCAQDDGGRGYSLRMTNRAQDDERKVPHTKLLLTFFNSGFKDLSIFLRVQLESAFIN